MNRIEDNETLRKGPWTEHEDVQLVFYVNMFGDRRWDFVAKVSGLKRTGKSCRLRWVNYLHPGLKRGRMTPHEEKLVLEYHSKWGNRWSRIARKLPGRTDNEIKNYWRTHMRKKAQENKRMVLSPSSSFSNSSNSSSSTCTNDPTVDSMPMTETKERSFYDTGGIEMAPARGKNNNATIKHNKEITNDEHNGIYSMDELWKDIELLENGGINLDFDLYSEVTPQIWDYSLNNFWMMDGGLQEFSTNMFFPATSEQLLTG